MGQGNVICIKNCSGCNKEVEIRHKDRLNRENIFCCKQCESIFKKRKSLTKTNVECSFCNKKYYLKPSHLNKIKNPCCSYECSRQLRKITMKGENNHQYGLKGNLNASWLSDEKITNYGYKKIRVINHPFKDCDDFVFEHRLIAEKFMLDDTNSVIIDGQRYLKPDLIVHHKDKNRLNNSVNNLEIMTLNDHTSLHQKEK